MSSDEILVVIVKSWLKSLIGTSEDTGCDLLKDSKSKNSELGNGMSSLDTNKEQESELSSCNISNSKCDSKCEKCEDLDNVKLPSVELDKAALDDTASSDVTVDDTVADDIDDEDVDEGITCNKQIASGVDGAFDSEADDPLGEAFDLDGGESLAHIEAPTELPWKARVSSAKEFFATEILYRHDILLKEERDRLAGQYRIELKGYQGGVWSLDVGDDISVVNRREEAPVVMTMQQSDFMRIVNGELNPQIALLARKIRVTGDVRKAVALQLLLAPSSE